MDKPNPKTKRLPKSIIRKPVFQPGTCLSIKLSNGQYGAAIVLAADHTKPEYGMNLIGVLRYMSSSPPQLPDFLERNWLRLTHHKWQGAYDVNWYLPVGFRKTQSRITVVGEIPITQTDPLKSETYTRWQEIGEQIVFQTDWEMNHK
jgi:hypothetical protein